ncbi:MAG: twin-arginine translocation signal domain-containing protein [Gordonia sp.]|nr:twin-arginine translocation signal domain-containing protein [Gordonia sp. (in: high G+C Gram-positive bacteria)]
MSESPAPMTPLLSSADVGREQITTKISRRAFLGGVAATAAACVWVRPVNASPAQKLFCA